MLVIDKDTDDTKMKKIFSDINLAVSSMQLVVHTSKMGCGADIQEKFDVVYLNCTGREGPNPRELFQMNRRPREVEDLCVYVVLPPLPSKPSLNEDNSAKEELRLLRKKGDRRRQYAHESLGLIGGNPRDIAWVPDDYALMIAQQSDNEHFTTAFFRQLKQKGWKIAHDTDPVAPSGGQSR